MEAKVRARVVVLGGSDHGEINAGAAARRRGVSGVGAAEAGAAAPRAVAWRLAARRAVAVLRLAGRVAVGPLAAGCALCALAAAAPRLARARRLALCAALCAAVAAAAEWRRVLSDPIHRLWLGLDSAGAWSGLVHGGGARLASVLRRAGLLGGSSSSASSPSSLPSWSCGAYSGHVGHGDVATLTSSLLCARAEVVYRRVCFASAAFPSEAEGICLDWSFPARGEFASAVVVVLAGVGGDSSAGYVRAAVRAVTSRGWAAVVCGPRGLGNTPDLCDVRHLFDPSDVRDVVRALELVDLLCGQSTPLLLLGFSLGGITLCNVLGRCAGQLPARLCGALSVSGAFRCDMLSWPRYERVYQPVIVPELLLDLCGRYHSQLLSLLGGSGLESLLSAATYTQLWERLYAPLSQRTQHRSRHRSQHRSQQRSRREQKREQEPHRQEREGGEPRQHEQRERESGESEQQEREGGEPEQLEPLEREGGFAAWKAAQEGDRFRQHIAVPLLLLSAADDPLHPPECIGAQRGDAALDSGLVAYLITEHGGHVSWPDSLASPDFGFLTRLLVTYFSSCLEQQQEQQQQQQHSGAERDM